MILMTTLETILRALLSKIVVDNKSNKRNISVLTRQTRTCMKVGMNKHCKGCAKHHNAGHKQDSPLAKIYNDWCCGYGKTAKKAIGQCKNEGGKQ